MIQVRTVDDAANNHLGTQVLGNAVKVVQRAIAKMIVGFAILFFCWAIYLMIRDSTLFVDTGRDFAGVVKSERICAKKLGTLGAKISVNQEGHVVGINMDYSQVTDSSFECIMKFSQLERLKLSNTKVTRRSISVLITLTSLKHLSLPSSNEVFSIQDKCGVANALPDTKVTDIRGQNVHRYCK